MEEIPNRPFRADELEKLGITRHELRRWVAEGLVRRPFVGVYCSASIPDTTLTRAQCVVLVVPPHAVLCERSASWLHRVDLYDYADLDIIPPLEIISVDGHSRLRRSGVVTGERTLAEEDICVVAGVRVTSPARTACDLARLRGRNAALAALDAFMRICGVTHQDLWEVAGRLAGRRGVKQLRELIPLATPKAESTGESWTRMAIHDAGLPTPAPNAWVPVPEYGLVRLDLAYLRLKVAVEYDGREFHEDEEAEEHDNRRRQALARDGWLVIVVTRDDFSGEALEAWLARVREGIRERRPVRTRRYSRAETWPPRRTPR